MATHPGRGHVLVSPSIMAKLTIQRRGKPAVDLALNQVAFDVLTVGDVRAALAARVQLQVERIRLSTTDKAPLKNDKELLRDLNVSDGGVLVFKDLGPQLSWTTVFIIEYLGPLFIHPLMFYCGKGVIYSDFETSRVQEIVYKLVMVHFIKRELETVFVHRFSHGTMPFRNVFRNSAHYWILGGVLLAFSVYSPALSAQAVKGTILDNDTYVLSCMALWTFAEVSNFLAHYTLRNLRPPGTTIRQIPYGYPFQLISCPNYFFESMAWFSIILITGGSYGSIILWTASTFVMSKWALQRHSRYKKEFGKAYPRNRKAIFPFIL